MWAKSTAHLKENLWLWIAILTSATVAALAFRWGSTAALLGGIAGILIMWKSDEARLAALADEMAAEDAVA